MVKKVIILICVVVPFSASATSLDIQANNDHVPIIASALSVNGGPLTFGAWFVTDADPGDSQAILYQMHSTSKVRYILRYEDSGGTNRLSLLRDRDGVSTTQINCNQELGTSGRWWHIVGYDDGTNLRIYLDGEQLCTGSSATGSGNTGSDNFSCGRSDQGPSGSVDGRVAHCFLYSVALSADRIKLLSRRSPPRNDPSLELYWPLSEGSGTIIFNHENGNRYGNGSVTTPIWTTQHPPMAY